MSQIPMSTGAALLVAGLLPLLPVQNGAPRAGAVRATRAIPEFRESTDLAPSPNAGRLHAWRGGEVPDRARVLRAFANTPDGNAQLRSTLDRDDDDFDGFLSGHRGRNGREDLPSRYGRDPWHSGLMVDAWAPEAIAQGRTAMALRMRTVLITGDFNLRDMAARHVVRIRALDPDPLLKLTLEIPDVRHVRVQPYLVSLGIATDDFTQEGPAFRILIDGCEVPYSITPEGVQLAVGLGGGCHTVMVRALPCAYDDVFEFRYAMVNRL